MPGRSGTRPVASREWTFVGLSDNLRIKPPRQFEIGVRLLRRWNDCRKLPFEHINYKANECSGTLTISIEHITDFGDRKTLPIDGCLTSKTAFLRL